MTALAEVAPCGLPEQTQDEAKVLSSLRFEALSFLPVMPHWMKVEDLISAGWLGYQKGWAKTPVHQFAKKWARYEMLGEIRLWYGAGRMGRGGVHLVQFDREHYMDLTDEGYRTFEERVEAEEIADKMIAGFLSVLPRRLRAVMWLRFVEGLTHREIGERMTIPTNCVGNQIRAGLKMLRMHIVGKRPRRKVKKSSAVPSATSVQPQAKIADGLVAQPLPRPYSSVVRRYRRFGIA